MNESRGEPDASGLTTHYMAALKTPGADRERAAAAIWETYYERLAGLARAAHPNVKRAADPEDMAASAFKSVVRLIEAGSPHAPADGDGLWLLLVQRMRWKSLNHLRRERTLRRGGRVVNASALEDDPLPELPAREPSPEELEMRAEAFRACFDALGDDELRLVARLRLDGHTIEEIGEEIGLGRASVNRKLDRIRRIWRPVEDQADDLR